ncbi:MAG TPA: Sec-independent protein translocase protein TatB [Bauldia sp.]|nr:Sec-independent protein translocase protein TatB [Bauldia sp.]
MFEIGWTEILLIALVAIVVIGPKDLPRAMRIVGQWTGKMRRMAGEFQRQFNQALKEAELDDVRKDVEAIVKGDPLAGVKDDMRKLDAGVKNDMRRIDTSLSAGLGKEAAPTAKGEP